MEEVDATFLNEQLCAALAYDRTVLASRDPILRVLVSCGTPVILWHRPGSERQKRRRALEEVLCGRALRELPDIVLNQREAAHYPSAGADHAGRDLVLLWDDPGHVPPELDWQPPARKGVKS